MHNKRNSKKAKIDVLNQSNVHWNSEQSPHLCTSEPWASSPSAKPLVLCLRIRRAIMSFSEFICKYIYLCVYRYVRVYIEVCIHIYTIR